MSEKIPGAEAESIRTMFLCIIPRLKRSFILKESSGQKTMFKCILNRLNSEGRFCRNSP